MSNNYLLRNGIQFNQNYCDEEYENDEYFGQIVMIQLQVMIIAVSFKPIAYLYF